MKLNKRLKELTSKIDNLESEIKSIKKIVKRPTCNQPMVIVVPPVESRCRKLQDFYCGPDKSASGSSTVNALVKNFGINQNGIMTFKTGYISSFGTFYNGKDLSLSVTSNHVILHINKMRVRAWSISRVLKSLHDKNSGFNTTSSQLKEMILSGKIKLRFNVSAIKDHGTYWKIK